MEIKVDQPNENKQRVFIQFAITGKLITITCILAETQSQAEEWESFRVTKKEGFEYVMNGDCWHRKAVGELTRSRASCVIG